MKIKTQDLTPPALDYAVALAEKHTIETWHTKAITIMYPNSPRFVPFYPSRDWATGGPIIEREQIGIAFPVDMHGWAAAYDRTPFSYGLTPLIAAMRCYVADKLGDEVEIPEELS